MGRYIDIEFILNETDEFEYENGVLHSISGNSAPSIDIVRCRECKHYEDPDHKIFENCVKWKESHGILLPMKPNDSCSYGSRDSEKPNNCKPQMETEIAKAIVHKMIDDAVIAEDAYPDLRQKMHDAVDEYEPQTERRCE